MKFKERLLHASRMNRSVVCIGLDFEMQSVPAFIRDEDFPILSFNQAIIEATKDLVCAYKPNIAFYEKHAERGLTSLRKTIEMVPEDIPVILDCKRGDIGSTAKAYAEAYFDDLGVDAVTVNPYLGSDAIEPFLNYDEKGVFVVCRTTNAAAGEFQDLPVQGSPLFEHVARRAVKEWNAQDNIGLVAPGTQPRLLQQVRRIAGPNIPILVPGVGAQGGRPQDAVQCGANIRGEMVLVNASRSILYASQEKDFAVAARSAAQKLKDECNEARNVSISP